MTTLIAIPYAAGPSFTFESLDEFERKMEKLRKRGIEEVEISFQDGEEGEAALFNALWKGGVVGFQNLEQYFDDVVNLNEHDQVALYWYVDRHGFRGDLDEALQRVDDEIRMFEGSAEDYAHELIDDIGIENVSNPESYFDYETFGRDLGFDLDADNPDDEYYLSLDDEKRGEEYVDSIGFESLGKDIVARYFDYEKFARDLDMGGDVDEFTFGGKTWTCTNAAI